MKKRVLLIDDVEFNLEFENSVIKTFIEETGIIIEVDIASTVKEGLEKIEKNTPYDALITDMNLPDGTGLEIAKASLKKSEATRRAALTIYPSKYEHQRAFFDLFLRKPIMPESFKENLARLLQV